MRFREWLREWLLENVTTEESEPEPEPDRKDYFGSQEFFEDFIEGVQGDLGEEFFVDGDEWSVEFFNSERGKYIIRFYATVKPGEDSMENSEDKLEADNVFRSITGNLKVLDPNEEKRRQREIQQRKEGEE